MPTLTAVLTRLAQAWFVLLRGLPPVPALPPDELAAIRALLTTSRSSAVHRAVRKVLADPSSHPTPTVKRDEALEWATTYEYGSRRPWEWEHALLLEYWVGVEKGRLTAQAA